VLQDVAEQLATHKGANGSGKEVSIVIEPAA
jgi:hypothetical protein